MHLLSCSSTTPCSPNASPITQRSLEEQCSIGLDNNDDDGPSESLRKACLYISQKAVMGKYGFRHVSGEKG